MVIDSSDSVELDKDYKYSSSDTGSVTISGTKTIDGKGHTVDADGKNRIFTIRGNGVVTLKNLKIINGKYEGPGSGVNSNVPVNIENCTFINNSGYIDEYDSYNAGAIYLKANNSVINGSTFINNSANKGGAVYIEGSNINITNSFFIQNKAVDMGAGVFSRNNYDGPIYLLNNTFDNNHFLRTSGCMGSAIYIDSPKTYIEYSKFILNLKK